MTIRDNTITYTAGGQSTSPTAPVDGILKGLLPFMYQDETPVGISLDGIRSAKLNIIGNKASGVEYGLKATQMDDESKWFVQGNDFGGVPNDVYYDDSVSEKPIQTGSPLEFPDPHLDMGDQPYDKLPTTQADHNHG